MSKNENPSQKKFNDSVCYKLSQKLRRLYHWAPIVALFIIFYIAAVTTNCISHLYHPFTNVYCFLHFAVYIYEFYLVMNNYLTGSFLGPGFVPLGWTPKLEADKQLLQFCELCEGYKPPRAHHCRKCDRCVLKMDHHCPWINSCCGHQNHAYFVYFLLFAPIGCLHSTVLLCQTLYYAIYLDFYLELADDQTTVVMLGLWEFLLTFFAVGLALGVVAAVGSLWLMQMRAMAKNETAIEAWIRTKWDLRDKLPAEAPFVYPYDLGSQWANLRDTMTWSGHCNGDGVEWRLQEGCGKYDLTTEQLKQKRDKEAHSQLVEVRRLYNGSLLPLWSFGLRVTFGSPCTDEARLPVRLGQRIRVTRWRKHWLYGQILYAAGEDQLYKDRIKGKPRGWFPRFCCRPIREDDGNQGRSGASGDSSPVIMANTNGSAYVRHKAE